MKKSSKLYKPISGKDDKENGVSRDFDGISESVPMKRAVSPAASSARFPTILDAKQKEELRDYTFSFNAVVVEGGGNKGLSSVGAIRALEELGYWENITRFAGASAGSMVAALMAIGYNSHDIETFLRSDIENVFLDARFGLMSLLPNMLMDFGWHPGKRIHAWFGEKIQKKMQKPDLTFEELYKETGRELCITVSNISIMDCMYCHPKTTPDMPIREAIRMSACIPGVFSPVKVDSKQGPGKDYFVDGGLLCNYPIHCYDGWYLSMDPANSFLNKMQNVEEMSKLWDPTERFGERNDKTPGERNDKTPGDTLGDTLGILLYSGEEREVMKKDLTDRFKTHIKPHEKQEHPPKSKLAKQRAAGLAEQKAKAEEHRGLLDAYSRFLTVLKNNDIDHSGTISLKEFVTAMEQESPEFTKEHKKRLFGEKCCDVEALFRDIDTNANGEVTFSELMSFAKRQGLNIMEYFRGYSRLEVTNLKEYFGAIMESLLLNIKRIFVKNSDVHRTIGIDTGYLDTLDFKMEPVDQKYLVQQGKLGCIALLREHIAEGRMTRKTK